MKAFLMTLMVVPALLAAQVSTEARQIPLDEAVRLARRNSPTTIQARNSIRTNAAAVRTRYSAFLPTLTFGAGVSRQDGTRFVADQNLIVANDQPWRGSHRFNSGLTIFDGGERYFQLRAAQAQVDAAEAAEISQNFTVALNVKTQYFAVLAARESQGAATKQLETAQQQLRAATARVSAGAATSSDSLRSSIAVGNARLAMLEADNRLAAANANLSRLVGSTDIVTALISDTSSTESVSLSDEELLRLAADGPAVNQAEAALTAAKQSSRAAKTPYLPTLSASLGWSFSASDTGFRFTGDQRNRNISTGLSINFPLFQGLGREQQVVAANVAEDNAAAQLRDQRLNQRQQVITLLGNFRTAEARVQIQQASVAAAEEDLRVMQERYNLGASTLLELLQSQGTLDTARQQLITARLDVRTFKAQLEQLIGRDL
jgi:outer membrane protein